MATTLYFNSTTFSISAYNLELSRQRGASATSVTGNTTANGTWISLGYWAMKPIQPITISGSISVNLRGAESATQANASLGVRLYKYSGGSLSTSLGQPAALTELGTTEGAVTATFTPTSTAYASGDIIVVEVAITNGNGVTMGNGRTVTFYYAGPTAAASGDSYITFTENFLFKQRAIMI